MTSLPLTLFFIGAPVFAVVVIYYLLDYKKTGTLYRVKLPWMPIGFGFGLVAVAGLFLGIGEAS